MKYEFTGTLQDAAALGLDFSIVTAGGLAALKLDDFKLKSADVRNILGTRHIKFAGQYNLSDGSTVNATYSLGANLGAAMDAMQKGDFLKAVEQLQFGATYQGTTKRFGGTTYNIGITVNPANLSNNSNLPVSTFDVRMSR